MGWHSSSLSRYDVECRLDRVTFSAVNRCLATRVPVRMESCCNCCRSGQLIVWECSWIEAD